MKTVKKLSFAAVAALSLVSFGSLAQTVSAISLTMDGAQAKIAAQARSQNEQYRILEASTNNRVHMTAELYK
ncbi:YdgH/BhsA/McbA-like domain containing protein [Pantoea sp. R13S299]|uniref:YdgH/BhsA/McbA-like domain containing protein n=1 Tax=Pantoea sp. R13S299 TaxID=3402751 RepID=UPI003AE002B0